MDEWITSGRVVRDHVGAGWELWLIASSPLPGRWELRRGREHKRVHWDAIERIRRHYLAWFDAHTTYEKSGRYGAVYRPVQIDLEARCG